MKKKCNLIWLPYNIFIATSHYVTFNDFKMKKKNIVIITNDLYKCNN